MAGERVDAVRSGQVRSGAAWHCVLLPASIRRRGDHRAVSSCCCCDWAWLGGGWITLTRRVIERSSVIGEALQSLDVALRACCRRCLPPLAAAGSSRAVGCRRRRRSAPALAHFVPRFRVVVELYVLHSDVLMRKRVPLFECFPCVCLSRAYLGKTMACFVQTKQMASQKKRNAFCSLPAGRRGKGPAAGRARRERSHTAPLQPLHHTQCTTASQPASKQAIYQEEPAKKNTEKEAGRRRGPQVCLISAIYRTEESM
eukprot:COSAG06_NODE_3618_length_5113_cov_26.588353_6_plen_257_part_00